MYTSLEVKADLVHDIGNWHVRIMTGLKTHHHGFYDAKDGLDAVEQAMRDWKAIEEAKHGRQG